MKKSSKKNSGRISAIVLLPIIAVLIAVPVILTILVEAPIGSGTPSAGISVTAGGSPSENSADPDPGGTSPVLPDGSSPALPDASDPSGSSLALPDAPDPSGSSLALPNGSAPDASELPDSSIPSQEGSTNAGQNSTGSDSSAQAENTDIPAPPCTLDDIPPYSGELYATINENVPFFQTPTDFTESFERYAPLDPLGRCGTAFANIGQDLMPTEERGAIGQIRPSGWHTVKYEGIDGNYLYNRCHLIAYQLAGENANERNLITGTRMFNAVGMLAFEEMVGDYVRETGNHVLYRVTPMFCGNNLVADGVLMEAWSVEDHGDSICYNVFVYNAQPGIVIDYATGDSHASADLYAAQDDTPSTGLDGNSTQNGASPADSGGDTDSNANSTESPAADYVFNTNTGKFHYPHCSSVQDMAEHNKLYYSGSREDVIAMGYVPCKRCNP